MVDTSLRTNGGMKGDSNKVEQTQTIQWDDRTLTVRAGGEPIPEEALVYSWPLAVVSLEADWLDAVIYYKFHDSDRFGEVTDSDGNIVGIPCPSCGKPMLYDKLRVSVDVWGVGHETFLVCPHMEVWGDEPHPEDPCNTLVFIEDVPPAYEVAELTAMAEALWARTRQDERRLAFIEAKLVTDDSGF